MDAPLGERGALLGATLGDVPDDGGVPLRDAVAAMGGRATTGGQRRPRLPRMAGNGQQAPADAPNRADAAVGGDASQTARLARLAALRAEISALERPLDAARAEGTQQGGLQAAELAELAGAAAANPTAVDTQHDRNALQAIRANLGCGRTCSLVAAAAHAVPCRELSPHPSAAD